MDRNNQKQVEHLRNKTEEFAADIKSSYLSRGDAMLAVKSTIMKTLEYPMAAINLTYDQWEYIMIPLRKSCLPVMGYFCNFPKDLVHGPTAGMGLDIKHPFIVQGLR